MDSENRRPRILVADDEPDVVTVVRDLLEANGYDTIDAGDGLDAIVEGIQENPLDLVILDIMMPEADGIGVLNALKAVHPELPVIMLTAKTAPEDIEQGYEWGCDAYVTKPYEPEHLLAEVKRVLADRTATA